MFIKQRIIATTVDKIVDGEVTNLTKLNQDSLNTVKGTGIYVAIVQHMTDRARIVDVDSEETHNGEIQKWERLDAQRFLAISELKEFLEKFDTKKESFITNAMPHNWTWDEINDLKLGLSAKNKEEKQDE